MAADPVRLDDLIEGIKKTHADELDQLSGAVLVAERLGDVADHLIGHFVDQARRSGASWTDIGQSMGVTKQAARKRGVPKFPAELKTDADQGFSRFSPRARAAVVAAQEVARTAGNREIGPAHLTLGLLTQPEGLAARAIVAQSVAAEAVQRTVTGLLPPASAEIPALIPFDATARKALELTSREALRLGHDWVGTEHMLLALLEQEDGSGTLTGLGLTKQATEEYVAAVLATVTPPAR
jgi:hypothetical protein